MITEEMLEFIRGQRASGMSDNELAQLLLTEGDWAQADIDEAFRALAAPAIIPSPPLGEAVPAPIVPPALVSPNIPITEFKYPTALPLASAPTPAPPSRPPVLPSPAALATPPAPPSPVLPSPMFSPNQVLLPQQPKPPFLSQASVSVPSPVVSPQSFGHTPRSVAEGSGGVRPDPLMTERGQGPSELSSLLSTPHVADEEIVQPRAVVTTAPSGPFAERSLIQSKMPHDAFLGLFSGNRQGKGVEQPLSQTTNSPEESPRTTSLEDTLATLSPGVIAMVPRPTDSKKSEWSLAGLLAKKESAPYSSPLNDSPGEQSAKQTVVAASVPGIKFDLLSALRATPSAPANAPLPANHILADQQLNPPPASQPQRSIEKAPPLPMQSHATGIEKPEQGVKIDEITAPKTHHTSPSATLEQVKGLNPSTATDRPTPPMRGLGPEEKRVAFTGKRTMMSDLLRKPDVISPPLSPPPSSAQTREEDAAEKKETPSQEPFAATPALFPGEPTRREKIKRVLIIAVGTVLLLAVLGGGIFAFMKFRSPDTDALLGTAFSQFFELSSFTYKGEASADLALSAIPGRGGEDGKIKFVLGYQGSLAHGEGGYGDGTHKLAWNGGWQSGTSTFGTNVASDVLSIGDEFYFNILSVPEASDLDPALLRSNWIKVNLAEIAREFQIEGVLQGEEEYGSFGGTTGDTSLSALLRKSLLLHAVENPLKEELAGVSVFRTHVRTDPDLFAEFLRALYRKYWNRDLTFSEEELLRLKAALAKIEGDVWVDEKTGDLLKLALAGDLDDDISEVHVKGPVALLFSFTDFNKPPLFGTPSPVLSLPELKVELEESKKLKGARAKDEVRISHMTLLTEALALYRNEKGRYPKELTELYAAKKITESSIDLVTLKNYVYRSYLKSGTYTKGGACLTTGKICAFYHMGTNLLDPKNNVLQSDADLTTAILGADNASCAKEANMSCYDVVSPVPAATTAPASSTTTTAPAPPR
ncbi:MAG: hypothetical protein Q7S52_03260 [bacterium]|nr:hypothetical protein [bacterium]